jgi:cytochrome c peroxidase
MLVPISSLALFFTIIFSLQLSTTCLAESSTVIAWKKLYKRPSAIPQPEYNKSTPERIQLGKMLFFDPRLSGSNWISCATCHNPGLSWGDGLAKGFGHGMKQLSRRTPTLLNLAWGELMFWDGRASSLEEQALGPLQNENEMNAPHADMQKKLTVQQYYKPYFDKAYPSEGMNEDTLTKAIATFERSIISSASPFDRWINGTQNAISKEAKHGFEIFNGKGKCSSCHTGWRFTDDGFHDIGIADSDIGRGSILPDIPALKFAFKTPTLRNIDHRAPYMHNGSEFDLDDVIDLYNRGGRVRRETVAEQIRPLELNQNEKDDLISFLKTLTSKDKEIAAPMLPR